MGLGPAIRKTVSFCPLMLVAFFLYSVSCSDSSTKSRNALPASTDATTSEDTSLPLEEPAGASPDELRQNIVDLEARRGVPFKEGSGGTTRPDEEATLAQTDLLLVRTSTYRSIAILVFGFLLLVLQVIVILKKENGWNENGIKMMGITLILTTGCFLITSGYSETQITPMIGLLGTIAGYILGRSGREHT